MNRILGHDETPGRGREGERGEGHGVPVWSKRTRTLTLTGTGRRIKPLCGVFVECEETHQGTETPICSDGN